MEPSEICLRAVGTALPGPPIDNRALARRFGMDALWEQWIDTFIGTRTRHLSLDLESGEVRQSLADLGATAGRRALAAANVDASEIDLLVLGTSTPDALMPATVNVVADRLGIDGVSTFQLQCGCSGAVQAIDLARQLLSTGRHSTALVLGGDMCAKHFDLGADLKSTPPEVLVNAVLFGDGCGAAVLSAGAAAGSVRLRHVLTRLTGLNRAPGQTLDWFGPNDIGTKRASVSEDYKAIEESVPVMSVEILKELLDTLGWQASDVDYLLPPQLSGKMTAKIVEALAVPDAREVSCIVETGNTGNALPFLQLERTLRQLGAGQRAVAIAVESSKWIKAGFALERV